MAEPFNKDVAVLAKKVYELSTLPPGELDQRKWEALILLSAAYGSATAEGIAKANADKEARWGNMMRAEGLVASLHPKWHLRTDDGKPPVVQIALASGLSNPHRDLRARLAALMHVPENERAPLDDVVRAFSADAFAGATGDAKNAYIDAARKRDPDWFKKPWVTVTPDNGNPPPAMILVDNQGETHDGGIHDDPADDTRYEEWRNGIRSWNVDFLRDNSAAQFFLGAESVAAGGVELAGGVVEAAAGAAKGIGAGLSGISSALKYLPAILGTAAVGTLAIGVGIIVWSDSKKPRTTEG